MDSEGIIDGLAVGGGHAGTGRQPGRAGAARGLVDSLAVWGMTQTLYMYIPREHSHHISEFRITVTTTILAETKLIEKQMSDCSDPKFI